MDEIDSMDGRQWAEDPSVNGRFTGQDSEGGSSSTADLAGWTESQTRQLRVLLHLQPILSLRRKESHRKEGLEHYDSLAVAIRIFDLIVENRNLGEVLTFERVLDEISPLLARADQAEGIPPDRERHREVQRFVFRHLLNSDNNNEPFLLRYPDFEEPEVPVWRTSRFRLLERRHHPEGGWGYDLSDAGVNVFLSSLDRDVEDEQAASEAVLEHQVRRGKLHKLAHSSRVARKWALQYRALIDRYLRRTRRDIRGVDWQEEVPRKLKEASEHTRDRLDHEYAILDSVSQRIDRHEPGSEEARQLADAKSIVDECSQIHVRLHRDVMDARQVFLDAQAQQGFRPEVTRALRIGEEVLEPLLRAPAKEAQELLDSIVPSLVGPCRRRVLELDHALGWMLRPRKTIEVGGSVVTERELVDTEVEIQRFPEHVVEEGTRWLTSLDEESLLSDLLMIMADAGVSHEVQEYVALCVLYFYAPEESQEPPVRTTPLLEGRVATDVVVGNEFRIVPQQRNGQ